MKATVFAYCIIIKKQTNVFHVIMPQQFIYSEESNHLIQRIKEIEDAIVKMEQDTLVSQMRCIDNVIVLKFPFAYNASANRSRIVDVIAGEYGLLAFDMYEYWNYEGITNFTVSVGLIMDRIKNENYTQFFHINRTPAKAIPTGSVESSFVPVKGTPYIKQKSN